MSRYHSPDRKLNDTIDSVSTSSSKSSEDCEVVGQEIVNLGFKMESSKAITEAVNNVDNVNQMVQDTNSAKESHKPSNVAISPSRRQVIRPPIKSMKQPNTLPVATERHNTDLFDIYSQSSHSQQQHDVHHLWEQLKSSMNSLQHDNRVPQERILKLQNDLDELKRIQLLAHKEEVKYQFIFKFFYLLTYLYRHLLILIILKTQSIALLLVMT
jgi:hypothetical protein